MEALQCSHNHQDLGTGLVVSLGQQGTWLKWGELSLIITVET